MKILCVIDSLGSGGAQRQMVELAKGFKEYGHNVSFLTYHHSDFYRKTLEEENISVHTLATCSNLSRMIRMRKYIRGLDCDIVLSFLEVPNFICSLATLPFKKWKLIIGERSANPKILTSPKAYFLRTFHVLADYVVANSHSNIRMVRRINPLLRSKKCKVIYNAVDENIWNGNSKFYNTVKVVNKNNCFNLIVVASHRYLKNARGLINAVNLLSKEEQRKLKVHWYGEAEHDGSFVEARDLIANYNLKDMFFFHPPTNRIKERMMAADTLGLFSYYEGMPNAVCEAMMLGMPVIASKVSDIPKFIDEDFTFRPDDIRGIAMVLSKIINMGHDDLLNMGQRNKYKAKLMFSKQNIVQSYLKLFNV